MHSNEASGTSAIQSDDELLVLHSQLQEAERLRLAKQTDRAQSICENLLRKHPDYLGALQTIGLIFADKGDFQKALGFLNQAVMLNPKDWRTLTALGGVYLQQGATGIAAVLLERAQKLKPDDASLLLTLGELYREEREYEQAADSHQRAYRLDPSLHDALLGYGLSCTQLGRNEEAASAFERHLALNPNDFSTLFSLSLLPATTISVDLLALLNAAEARKISKEEFEGAAAFSKTTALDKAGRHDEAWRELVAANRPIWVANSAEAASDAETRRDFMNFVRDFPAKIHQQPSLTPTKSFFILGPSRSGKTTAERLIASLAGVKRGYENPIIENSVRRTFQTAGLVTRDRLVELPPGLDSMFLDFYREELKERSGTANVFTNTHPGRIFDVLRLASAVPNTRFLFIKRDIDDIAIRIFMKRYNAGHFYSYDLKSTYDYVRWYYDMMDLCAAKLPSICKVVHYEDMIAHPESVMRAAGELCGLSVGDLSAASFSVGDDRGAAAPYKTFMGVTG